MRRWAAAGSILLHLLLILWALVTWSSAPPPPPPPPPTAEQSTSVKLMTAVESDKAIALGMHDRITDDDPGICAGHDKHFTGIGIVFSFGTNKVTSAPPQYPAYKAGIRVDDVLEDPWGITNTPYPIAVSVTRNGRKLTFMVKPADICFRTGK